MTSIEPLTHVKLVVLDLAGTIVDYGSCAPAGVFVALFEKYGIQASLKEAREPMGMHKKDHIRTMLEMPSISDQWRQAHGRAWNPDDLEQMYREFIPLQLEQLPFHSEVIDGACEVVAKLRATGLHIATTTGYNQPMMQIVIDHLERQGLKPDLAVSGDDVEYGRPEPFMIQKCMAHFNVKSAGSVVKVGDTMADIKAGLNAGVWTVGVIQHGNSIGLPKEQVEQLPGDELQQRLNDGQSHMLQAGAHFAIETISDLPTVVREVEQKMKQGMVPRS